MPHACLLDSMLARIKGAFHILLCFEIAETRRQEGKNRRLFWKSKERRPAPVELVEFVLSSPPPRRVMPFVRSAPAAFPFPTSHHIPCPLAELRSAQADVHGAGEDQGLLLGLRETCF